MPDRYFIKRTGFIKASGNDLIDFINRMSTNDLRKFQENDFRKTILTTDKGRIIDLITLLNLKESKFILTSDNYQKKVKSHLDKFIIMDDVSLEISNSQYYHIIISGDVLTLSERLFDLKPELNKIYTLAENEFLFYDDFKSDTLNIICTEEGLEKFKMILSDLHFQTCEEYEYSRIEAGIPEGENEFNDNINPMECGLVNFISFNKGCYIGQEVIARLDSQGKLPKQMVKINADHILKKDEKIYLADDNKETGFISSAVNYKGKNAALGFIRSINLNADNEYLAGDSENTYQIKISIIN